MRWTRGRATVIALGLAAALVTTTACGGSSGPSAASSSGGAAASGAAPAAGGSGTASAWALTGGDEAAFRTSFTSWNSANPSAQIDPQFFANDAYKQKIRSAIGAGEAPTLIYNWGGGTLKSYVTAKKVVDLTGEVKSAKLDSRFFPSVLLNGQVGGKTYALPNNAVQPVVLYYNKDVFSKIGVTPPKTWDELLALIPKFKAAGLAPLSMGGQSKWPQLMWLEYLTDRLGGPTVIQAIEENKAGSWSNPAIIKALTMIQQLVDAGGFTKGFDSISTDSSADLALLYTGRAGMILQGSWGYPGIKTADPTFISSGKLGYTTFPTVTGGTGAPTDIVGNPANFWAVSSDANAGAQTAAETYLKSGVLNEANIDALIAGGSVPPVTGLDAKIAKATDPTYLSWVYKLAEKAPGFQLSWDQAISPAAADALLTNLDQIFLKQISPQDFATAMNKTIGT